MNDYVESLLNVQKFTDVPKTYNGIKEFFKAKGFDSYLIDEPELKDALATINSGVQLSGEQCAIFHQILDLGDTCGCDNDHRMRGMHFKDQKSAGYSKT